MDQRHPNPFFNRPSGAQAAAPEAMPGEDGATVPARTQPARPGEDGESGQHAEPFSIGDVIADIFAVLFKNPVPYIILALFACLPGFLFLVYWTPHPRSMGSLLPLIIDPLLMIIFTGGIAHCVYEDMVGRKGELAASIARGLGRFPSLVGILLLFFLVIILLALVAVALGRAGLVILVIAIVYLSCTVIVAVPACVSERLGPAESIARSFELTKGRRMSIFGLLVLGTIAKRCIEYVATVMLPQPFHGVILGPLICSPIFVAFAEAAHATLYFRLRAVKEGVSVDKLANVFD